MDVTKTQLLVLSNKQLRNRRNSDDVFGSPIFWQNYSYAYPLFMKEARLSLQSLFYLGFFANGPKKGRGATKKRVSQPKKGRSERRTSTSLDDEGGVFPEERGGRGERRRRGPSMKNEIVYNPEAASATTRFVERRRRR